MAGGSEYCTGAGNQNHAQEKERQNGLSEEALQIAEKRREVKAKGEKERHIHLNSEFHRTTSCEKTAYLINQCKETEENNRMEKTRDLF